MKKTLPVLLLTLLAGATLNEVANAQSTASDKDTWRPTMRMDAKGMVMNENSDRLPEGCDKIAGEAEITVRAGAKYARPFNGKIFAFDQQTFDVPPCTRLRVTLINDDPIRHQFMLHDLPPQLHPPFGMFHIELYGKGQKSGVLITPKEAKTYLIHCEVPQHMENGMKAQLKVAGGDGDLTSIPGVSAEVTPDDYPVAWSTRGYLILLIAISVGALLPFLTRMMRRTAKASGKEAHGR